MTRAELNEIIDACFIHLTVMKQFLTRKRPYQLSPIHQDNLDQINDLLGDIENSIKDGGITELEAYYIYDDTEGLWAEIEPQFSMEVI